MFLQIKQSQTRTAFVLLLIFASSGTSNYPAELDRRQILIDPKPKAGLGWSNGEKANISQFYSKKVNWYYSWSPWPVPSASLEFVPMLWGPPQVPDFQAQANAMSIKTKGYKHILGMNEPQEPAQSNMTPAEGAGLWKAYLEPLRWAGTGIRLGSPATSNSPSGKIWMQEWLNACAGGCTVDFIALHWYGLNSAAFIEHVTDFYNTFKRPIWVTEWACQNFGDPALGQFELKEISEFLRTTQSWMDNQDFVERYAWFGAVIPLPSNMNPDVALISRNGKITPLGKQYIGETNSVTGVQPTGGGIEVIGSPGGAEVRAKRVTTPFLLHLLLAHVLVAGLC